MIQLFSSVDSSLEGMYLKLLQADVPTGSLIVLRLVLIHFVTQSFCSREEKGVH